MRGHFASVKVPLGMKLVSALSLLGFITYLHEIGQAADPNWRLVVAFCLQILAGGLFVWACAATRAYRPEMAFSDARPTTLFSAGPYRIVRHPFYSSYILFWLACSLATTSIAVSVVTFILIVAYTAAALQEQNFFLNSVLRPQYEAYQKRTGLFWPRLQPRRQK